MVSILIKADSRYPIERRKLKDTIRRLLAKHGIKENSEVSIAIVGDRRMRQLNRKYKDLDETTEVLAFPLEVEGGTFATPPDGILRLGDVVISYPLARKQAAKENILVDEAIGKLAEHGVKHLLGID